MDGTGHLTWSQDVKFPAPIDSYRHDMWCGIGQWFSNGISYHLEHHWNIIKPLRPNCVYEVSSTAKDQDEICDVPSWWMLTY